jgi:hypothetical protein
LIRATTLVDRAFYRFQQLRSLLVTAFASDGVLRAYNDLTYSRTAVYDAGRPQFRETLFNWERDLVERIFPAPPCRVLVGAAGGGREPLELAARGYHVTAFEPSSALARSMAERAEHTTATVDSLLGGYEDLPLLRRVATGEPVDLRELPRFQASLLGWSSFSHLREATARIATLRSFADLTDGPVVVSFYRRPRGPVKVSWLRRHLDTLGRRNSGDSFTPAVGFFHGTSDEELEGEVRKAGLVLLEACYDESDGHWPWIAVARVDMAGGPATASGKPGSSDTGL